MEVFQAVEIWYLHRQRYLHRSWLKFVLDIGLVEVVEVVELTFRIFVVEVFFFLYFEFSAVTLEITTSIPRPSKRLDLILLRLLDRDVVLFGHALEVILIPFNSAVPFNF